MEHENQVIMQNNQWTQGKIKKNMYVCVCVYISEKIYIYLKLFSNNSVHEWTNYQNCRQQQCQDDGIKSTCIRKKEKFLRIKI